jgi:hypothetical protein
MQFLLFITLSYENRKKDFVQLDAGGAELCVDLDDGSEHKLRLFFFDRRHRGTHLQQTDVEITAGGPDKAVSHGSQGG